MTAFGRVAAGVVVTTPSACEIALTRHFAAPCRLVFRTLTEPELVRRWLYGPEGWGFAVCEIDLRVGGTFRYVWRHEDGKEMGMSGEYRQIVRPDLIVNTERFDVPFDSGESRVTTALAEWEDQTTLIMTVQYVSQEARDEAVASNMVKGIEAGFGRVEMLLESLLVEDG
ncbi:MAG TPA: SRPBCC domain-containing protein [Chloroflexota bacterium]|nr:SRPBCC domain-containing protein [Chloroflexota bacterium]